MKRLISFALALMLCASLAICAFAVDKSERLYDGADLLTTSEENAIRTRLDEVSEKYDVDVVIVTVDSVGIQTPADFSDDYYDGNGYGKDGVMLLISMEERDWDILTNGMCNDAMGATERENIGELITIYLSDELYADAFETYIDECEYYIDGHINGFPFEGGITFVISLVIGLVVALIVTSIMKGQLRSVRANDTATEYVKQGSMNVRVSRDIFLYRHISRTKRPESNSSSSSGGGGRGHSGGKF